MQIPRGSRARKIDVIVVYKVDRLTRSLADFAKLVEPFDIIEGAQPPLRPLAWASEGRWMHQTSHQTSHRPY